MESKLLLIESRQVIAFQFNSAKCRFGGKKIKLLIKSRSRRVGELFISSLYLSML